MTTTNATATAKTAHRSSPPAKPTKNRLKAPFKQPFKRPPRHARVLRRLQRDLPPKLHDIAYEPGLVVPAADGTPLLTDHYFPLTDGDFPTLLLRSPYGRGFPWALTFGVLFAEQGFHVVLQSCRGTGGSGGESDLWRHEPADGRATVAWLRQQPWFTGVLGTIGPSYLGYTQWALALDPPPELRAMVVQVGLHDLHGYFHPGGAFALENSLVTSLGRMHHHRGVPKFLWAALRLQRHLRKITRSLPLGEVYAPGLGGRVPFLEEAMAHPDPRDAHWQGADMGVAAERLTVPTSLITGWHDALLDQTLQQYGRLRRAGCETSLLVGPWTHNTALQQGWPEVFAESLAWLRAHLCDEPSGLRETRVRVHMGGTETWHDLPDWPAASHARRWYLDRCLDGGGALSPRSPGDTSAPLPSFRYDPSDPTPSVGGPLVSPKAGPRDNTALEARDDVLTFTSAPLAEPLRILGPVRVELRVGTGTGHADVFARLCDVDDRNRSTNVCDGLRRLRPTGDAPAAVTVPMSATAYRFPAGHRIRLQISGGAHPRFARNTGTAEPPATATRLIPADVSLHHPCALVLPCDSSSTEDPTPERRTRRPSSLT
ncbi:CocE/NonD family hydrolase [Streptomyces gilvosporeus]|uniref:Peptidase S15 n=1 Tax=Streptomyces gilvosporeus TaxID=553510 RepID=A0A1V0U0N4_9ACTN|nr:CocE/NonD family hydrolase [Streptomyces gilvosporeus]ARF58492.1 peptidase S15 [Streptomyces gilvosporeus]